MPSRLAESDRGVHQISVLKASEQIFEYRDYRTFLADEYNKRKSTEYGFSYRSFAKRVGSTAPNYLKLVTEGKRNLTPEMALRFAEALGLQGNARSYFCDLVAYNQATAASDRERYYGALRRYRNFRQVFRLDDAHEKYHSKWYIPAIRELCATEEFQPNPKWIAKKLRPSISIKEAEAALKTLVELRLLVANETGDYQLADPLVATGDDQPLGHHISTYHRRMMDRAAQALDEVPREQREVASLTLAVSPAEAARLKERLYAFRQELLQDSVAEAEEPRTEVVQINFQLFPLTNFEDEGTKK